MKNMEIFNHDSYIDVTHKVNSIELDNWINHLKYVEGELINLVNLCKEGLSINLGNETILERFQKKMEENEILMNALQKYSISRLNIIECEDTQCDMVYITEHETYRRSYVYHLDKYGRLKDEFFDKIQRKFAQLKTR
ncbi:hypothetical protein LRR18_11790 [Mangrovimonas sp. AS39]|uniref:hypothetical protein n=2 Tax=Mangrovimonas futianensis TaxID=2895523 RepID=UPI001E38196C|nr:hypothetical protein [Mangrovimonas futianensis]MCF1192268.1 hypothetical protein [Mangrovimonas futianensis]